MRRLIAGVMFTAFVILSSAATALAQDTACSPINDLAVKLALPRLMTVGSGAPRVHFLKGPRSRPAAQVLSPGSRVATAFSNEPARDLEVPACSAEKVAGAGR